MFAALGPARPNGFAQGARVVPQDAGICPRAQHATQEHLHERAGINHALQECVVESALPSEPGVKGQARGIITERPRLGAAFSAVVTNDQHFIHRNNTPTVASEVPTCAG